jgi:sortase A
MAATSIEPTKPAARATAAHATRRRIVRALGTLLIVIGVLALVDAGLTLVWQEPVTALYAHVQQSRLDDRLTKIEHASAAPVARAAASTPNPQERLDAAARAFGHRVHPGDPIARLRIPRLGLSAVVVQGTAGSDLSKGPGHYPKTPFPGERGTVGIAGHRTTFGAWFRHIDKLKPGDAIRVAMPYGNFTYRVQRTRIVPSDALWITNKVSYNRLVLSACHPLYSATKRIVVFARLA